MSRVLGGVLSVVAMTTCGVLVGSVSLSACGQIEVESGPAPDVEPLEANCADGACSCPDGSHFAAGDTTECQPCPFGTVSAGGQGSICKRSQIVAGERHTCVLLPNGAVRCWGDNEYGQLGYGHTELIGDDEFPRDAGDIQLGGKAAQISAGGWFTCALMEGGGVRCWGQGISGSLGLGDQENVGDDEFPVDRPLIDLGEPALQVAAGDHHVCALLAHGRIRCWGSGIAWDEIIGDDESPRAGPDVDLGGVATAVASGGTSSCAVLETGGARCWGEVGGGFGENGFVLSPADEGDLPFPGQVEQTSPGQDYICAVLKGGALICWGMPSRGFGQGQQIEFGLGYAVEVETGGEVFQVRASEGHTCALLSKGNVRCWGGGFIGYPDLPAGGGLEQRPDELGDVDVGGVVTDLAAGTSYTCALLQTGAVRCWGLGGWGSGDDWRSGWLGYGNTPSVGDTGTIGDDETPASAGDVPYL